jgi:hypothetical protein
MERLCPYDDKRGRSANSWLSGCTDGLSSRLYQLRQEAERSSRATREDQPRGNGRDLVLTDVYSSEDDLNNDMRWGYEAGTTARNRREREARWAAAAEARKNEPPRAPETPEERAKREKADARYYARFRRQRERANARVDHHAYEQGSYAGESIGLDKQVHHKPVGVIG